MIATDDIELGNPYPIEKKRIENLKANLNSIRDNIALLKDDAAVDAGLFFFQGLLTMCALTQELQNPDGVVPEALRLPNDSETNLAMTIGIVPIVIFQVYQFFSAYGTDTKAARAILASLKDDDIVEALKSPEAFAHYEAMIDENISCINQIKEEKRKSHNLTRPIHYIFAATALNRVSGPVSAALGTVGAACLESYLAAKEIANSLKRR